jgi:hypothetical protein
VRQTAQTAAPSGTAEARVGVGPNSAIVATAVTRVMYGDLVHDALFGFTNA